MGESESAQKNVRVFFLFSYVGHTAYCGVQKLVSRRTKCVENKGNDYAAKRSYCSDSSDVAGGSKLLC